MNRYTNNLPEGTPIYTVRSNGHNVPRPQSLSGFGAAANTGHMAGTALGNSSFLGSGK